MVAENLSRPDFERYDFTLADGDVVRIGGSESVDCKISVVSTGPIEVEVAGKLGERELRVRKPLEEGVGYRVFSRFCFYPQMLCEGGRDYILAVPPGTNVEVDRQSARRGNIFSRLLRPIRASGG